MRASCRVRQSASVRCRLPDGRWHAVCVPLWCKDPSPLERSALCQSGVDVPPGGTLPHALHMARGLLCAGVMPFSSVEALQRMRDWSGLYGARWQEGPRLAGTRDTALATRGARPSARQVRTLYTSPNG